MTHEERLKLQAKYYQSVTGACATVEEQQAYAAACLAGAEALALARDFARGGDHLQNCDGWHGPEHEEWHVESECDCIMGKMRDLLATEPTR